MKFNELKIGDRIKFTQGEITQEDVISSFHKTLIGISDGKLVHKDEVVCKLEPVFKEIPIEKPKKPFVFSIKVGHYNCKTLTNMDELVRYGAYSHPLTIIGYETEIQATADNGQPIYMKLPYPLGFGFNAIRVTIEEVP